MDGGPAAFHKAVAKIRARVARKLDLGKTAPVDAGAPASDDSARGCPACDKLETCCVKVTDSTSRTICYDALKILRDRCSQPPPMPKQMNLSCKHMHKAWLEGGECQ